MATLKEEATAYIPPQTKNIADLDEVSIDLELHNKTGKNNSGEEFNYKCVIVNETEYRVPGKVIGDIKNIIAARPLTTKVKVTKSGSGKTGTQYTVIPID